ncbi:unnamed protein product, partial [Laminaria digitata]
QAGGNEALALLLTVATNLLGVATVPFFVKAVLSVGNASTIDSVDLFKKLTISAVIPLMGGKFFREAVPGTKDWVQRWKMQLRLTRVFMFTMIVWQNLSRAYEGITSLAFGQTLS